MGQEITSPKRESDLNSKSLRWTCGACGFQNVSEDSKCKVCGSDAPEISTSLASPRKGTLRTLLGRKSSFRKDENSSRSLKSNLSDKELTRNSSQPKMSAERRMKTLIINKEENHALVFIKPTVPKLDVIRDAIEEHFNSFKCALTSEGTLTAKEIEKYGTIDKHYAALSKKALDMNPAPRILDELVARNFENSFGTKYSDDKVLTLGQFMKMAPNITPKEIDNAWSEGTRVKIAGGFYIGRLEKLEENLSIVPDYRPLLVVNGFYASMRADYLTEGNEVLYFTVEWKEKDLSWKDFRCQVVGATDPTKADPNSLRGKMLKHWKHLGLKEAPSVQNNCVHASAGPIEAMRERATWINMPLESDPFAQAMMNEGVPLSLIKSWSDNEIVDVNGKSGPAFDIFEDMDSSRVIQLALKVARKDQQDSPLTDHKSFDETSIGSPSITSPKVVKDKNDVENLL